MKRLFTFIKQLFTKKCDEPLHNHHDGCPVCTERDKWIDATGYTERDN